MALVTLVLVPVLSVGLVGGSWLVAHQDQDLTGARVFAQHHGHLLNLRALCVRVIRGTSRPLTDEVRVELWPLGAAGEPASTLTTAPGRDGTASLTADLEDELSGPMRIRLTTSRDDKLLGEGELHPEQIAALAGSRRGGWVEGKVGGALELRVGLLQGVLAVPFEGRLVVEVRHDDQPVTGVWVNPPGVSGARIAEAMAITDSRGRASFTIVPEQHVVEVSFEVTAGDQNGLALSGSWFGHLPVVAGALYSRVEDGRLWVSSPVERRWAYVDWYVLDGSNARLVWNANVPLRQDNGVFTGIVDLPKYAMRPGYVVTSSEADLQSMALVGWPVANVTPEATLDLRPTLTFDGIAQGRERLAQRRQRVKGYGSVGALLGALVEAFALILIARAPRPKVAVDAHDASVGHEPGRAQFWWTGACVVLALVALAALSWFS
jgi:hypothetical protein